MSIALRVLATSLRAAEALSPEFAGHLALPAYRSIRPRVAVAARDEAVHLQARREFIDVRGRPVSTYAWGGGERVVLLVHGWRSRASRFAPIVRELRAAGFTVIAFDAPGNGASAGRRTDIRDYLAAIEALHHRYGRFHLVVGHSFGALSALVAVHEGVDAAGVVAIAGMADARYLAEAFAGRLSLGPQTAEVLAQQFARHAIPDVVDPYDRFDAVGHPLPAEVPLLIVHDEDDREVGVGEARRLAKAHGDRSRLLLTRGAGHSRVLAADATLDAVTAFALGGLAAFALGGVAALAPHDVRISGALAGGIR